MTRKQALEMALEKACDWRPSRPAPTKPDLLAQFGADLIIEVEQQTAERCQTLAIRMSAAPVPREEAYRTGIRYAAEEIAKGIGDTFGLEPRP